MSCAAAIAILRAAYPGKAFPDQTVELYGRMLADLDDAAVTRAVERLIYGSEWLPTIHAIRTSVAEETLALPSPEEAWDIATSGPLRTSAPEVRAAAESVGGRWTILHGENLSTTRAQFIRSYSERRRSAIDEFTGARIPIARQHRHELGPTMRELPESATAFAPPVHGRWLRRMLGKPLDTPTSEEVAHAIEILRDGPPELGDPDPLYVEAERIHDEASRGPDVRDSR